jgi:acyl carrier protein
LSLEKLLAGLADILEEDVEALGEDYELDEENWDSMALLEAISLIDGEFGVTVSAKALAACKTVGAVWKLVRDSDGT